MPVSKLVNSPHTMQSGGNIRSTTPFKKRLTSHAFAEAFYPGRIIVYIHAWRIRPQAFQIVKTSDRFIKYMNEDVTVIEKDPFPDTVALNSNRKRLFFFHIFFD